MGARILSAGEGGGSLGLPRSKGRKGVSGLPPVTGRGLSSAGKAAQPLRELLCPGACPGWMLVRYMCHYPCVAFQNREIVAQLLGDLS